MELPTITTKPTVIITALLLLAGCAEPANQVPSLNKSSEAMTTKELSPWHSLTSDEITEAVSALQASVGEEIRLNRVSLLEPIKSDALAWEPGAAAARGADLIYRSNKQSYRATYDFGTQVLTEPETLSGGQPMLVGEELMGAVEAVNALPEVAEALERREVPSGYGLCLPRTTGRYFGEVADPVNDRLVRLDCFDIRGQSGLGILPSSSAFARPIEGLSVLFDVEAMEVKDFTDSFAKGDAPSTDFEVLELSEEAIESRAPLSRVEISQPKGTNFTISGSQVDWQNWQFHLRFDPRQGTILNRVGYVEDEAFRSIAYEIAMSEMFVPYQDPDPHWFYRAYFDMGEFGFGNMATELKGSDCPANAVYQDAVFVSGEGEPFNAPNRICIFETDPGYPVWRHHEGLFDDVPGIAPHQSRPSTHLVVRMVATIGNYDYFQDYVFQQDGRLRIRLISTGIDAAKGIFSANLADPRAASEVVTGTLIAPYRLGVNHDHFFSYRVDFDIDGQANQFVRHKLEAVAQPAGAPRQGIWLVNRQPVANEQSAQTMMSVDRPALLTFESASQTNAMGYPTSYQLMYPNIRPLVTLDDVTYQRAEFLKNNLWVTRYQRDELFSSGMVVNQSSAAQGLPQYISNNDALDSADLVAWPMIGFHHVPMAEDWPVMPSKVDEIVLKPRNFFDRNPALDVPK